MYIGKLNPSKVEITYQIFKKNTEISPKIKEAGNPFAEEKLAISWKEVLETGVDLHISVKGDYLLNELVLSFAQKSNPTEVRLYSAGKKEVLYVHKAETGERIANKQIALPIEDKMSDFVVEISTEFEDVILEKIDLYGADFSGEILFPTPVQFEITGSKRIALDSIDACECVWNSELPENGYHISSSENGVRIEASDLRGMVYAKETVQKLWKEGSLPECEIYDEPRMAFRGAHLMLPHPDEFEFAKRFVKYVLSPMGYNYIIMEIAGGMEFESHPEINAAVEEAFIKGANGEWPLFPHKEAGMGKTVKKAVLADFVDFCRELGIDVIPEIQSLGHVQFMTLPHPDIAERPEKTAEEKVDEREADIPPNEFYGHSYCPSNPKSYEILFDLMDEIIEVFRPREYVHMGHDEVYQIGVCPICKDKDPAELFAQDVNRIYEYLQKKGLKMMIWADMLQPVTKYKTWAAIDHIPKDIVLLDFIWYFHLDKDIEDHLLEKGFEVILGNMYSSHYPRYDSRISKEGISGAQVSSWVITSEDVMAREGKIYEFLYSGQMLWSKGYSKHSRYAYDKILKKMMPSVREQLSGCKYPSLQEGKEEQVFVDYGIYFSGKEIVAEDVSIDACVKSLIFEHTATEKLTRIPWIELDVIGTYHICYSDGSKEEIPVTYAGNIGYWNRKHNEPFKAKYYRHNGYQGNSYYTDGIETYDVTTGPNTLYRYEWINPHPLKKIETITYAKNEAFITDVYIARILGVK